MKDRIFYNKFLKMTRNFDYIVYHKNCPDGIGALWAASQYCKTATHYAMSPGDNPILENIKNRSILFVDICPQPQYVLQNVNIFKHITILDHHKSSFELFEDIIKHNFCNIEIVFKQALSGAQLSWDYFFGEKGLPRPFFIDYIADKDLWKFELKDSKEINFALNNHLTLDELTSYLKDEDESFNKLLEEGKILKKINDNEIKNIAERANKSYFVYGNKTYNIMIVEIKNRSLTSDVGNYLCEIDRNIDFAIITFKRDSFWSVSLRGMKEKCPDLSVIARTFGGGGHKASSGFKISSLEQLYETKRLYQNKNDSDNISAYIMNLDMYDINVNFSVDIEENKVKAKRRNAVCYTTEQASIISCNLKNEENSIL